MIKYKKYIKIINKKLNIFFNYIFNKFNYLIIYKLINYKY